MENLTCVTCGRSRLTERLSRCHILQFPTSQVSKILDLWIDLASKNQLARPKLTQAKAQSVDYAVMIQKYASDDDFLSKRNDCVNASELGILAGLTAKYSNNGGICTPYQLWELKLGARAPVEQNEAMRWGNILEESIVYEYLRQRPKRAACKLSKGTYSRHAGILSASADLLLEKGKSRRLLECKTTSFFGMKAWDFTKKGQDALPLHIYLQVQAQLLCYDAGAVDVALLANTSEFHIFEDIKPNTKVQAKIVSLAKNFWRHVQDKTPPPAINRSDVESLFPNITEEVKSISLDETIDIAGKTKLPLGALFERYSELGKSITKSKAEQEELKDALMLLMGDCGLLEDEEGSLLAKKTMSSRNSYSVDYLTKLSKLSQKKKEAIVDMIRDGSIPLGVPKNKVAVDFLRACGVVQTKQSQLLSIKYRGS